MSDVIGSGRLCSQSATPNLSMTPEEEAYEEALRPIRKAEETGARELDQPTWIDACG